MSLKVNHYKTGEDSKLSPHRIGPCLVIDKLPNGVNFRIINDHSRQQKIVHYDRLMPVRDSDLHSELDVRIVPPDGNQNQLGSDSCQDMDSGSESSTDSTDFEPDYVDSEEVESDTLPRQYPRRV